MSRVLNKMENISILNALDSSLTTQLDKLMSSVGWNHAQIKGQIRAFRHFLEDPDNCLILTIPKNQDMLGFLSVQFYPWNRLGQIHGLVITQQNRRQGLASKLMIQAENFIKNKNARGLYVDTPTNNLSARKFYESLGYKQDYIMTDYYDENNDGVTYLKLFKWEM